MSRYITIRIVYAGVVFTVNVSEGALHEGQLHHQGLTKFHDQPNDCDAFLNLR